jgi:hypothetical protein
MSAVVNNDQTNSIGICKIYKDKNIKTIINKNKYMYSDKMINPIVVPINIYPFIILKYSPFIFFNICIIKKVN